MLSKQTRDIKRLNFRALAGAVRNISRQCVVITAALLAAIAAAQNTAQLPPATVIEYNITSPGEAISAQPDSYKLLPKDRSDSDASSIYYLMLANWVDIPSSTQQLHTIASHLDDQVHLALAVQLLDKWRSSPQYQTLSLATKRKHCNWDLPIEQMGVSTPLPQLDKLREAMAYLSLQSRVDARMGDIDSAIEQLQKLMAVSYHISEAELMLTHLLAIAGQQNVYDCLIEIINCDNSPNLYWAIRSLPQEKLSLVHVIDNERKIMLSQPCMKNPLQCKMSNEQWRKCYEKWLSWTAQRSDSMSEQMQSTLAMSRYHAMAKAYFISNGMAATQAESYQPWQLILAHNIDVYRYYMDQIEKRFNLSYYQSQQMPALMPASRDTQRQNDTLAVSRLLPDMFTARKVIVSHQAKMAAICTVEAVRAYASSHGGWLPENLAMITQTPAPQNPYTGQLFDWQLQADSSGTLQYTEPDGRLVRFNIFPRRRGGQRDQAAN